MKKESGSSGQGRKRDGRAAREEVLPKASLDCRVPLELPREVEPAALCSRRLTLAGAV